MRVISGIYKRRRFDVPHSFKARPTTDFAKENLFNVLSNYMDFEDGIRALDLFAGTGSISIELVSRGCDQVISVEKDRDHYAFICKIMQELKTDKCLPIRGDVFKYLKSGREQFDFIFADPPYELAGLETLPDLIFENKLALGMRGLVMFSMKAGIVPPSSSRSSSIDTVNANCSPFFRPASI